MSGDQRVLCCYSCMWIAKDLRLNHPVPNWPSHLILPMMLMRENLKKTMLRPLTNNTMDLSVGTRSGPIQESPGGGFVCGDCARTYKLKSSLRNHRKWECGKEPQFKCFYCSYKAKQKMHLVRHMERMHKEIDYSAVKAELLKNEDKLTGTKSANTQPKIKILKVEDLKNDDIVARIKLELSQQWSLSKSDSLPISQKNSVLNHWLTKDVKTDPDEGKIRIQQVEITKVESDDSSRLTTRKLEKQAHDKILTDVSSEECDKTIAKDKKSQSRKKVSLDAPGKNKACASTSTDLGAPEDKKIRKPRIKKNVISTERMRKFNELVPDQAQPKPKRKPTCESSWGDIKKPVDRIRCIRCNDLFKRQIFLAHSKVCRGRKPAKKFRCLHCRFTHADIKVLGNHVREEHSK